MLEKEFQANVVELAQTCGWRIHHDRGDYRECIAGDPGFPDLVLARGGRIVFAELKAEKGKLSDFQVEWLTELAGEWGSNQGAYIGGQGGRLEVAVWRPSDIQQIAQTLSPRYK